ncbi:hypothetical protein ACGFJ7_35595 [Actinoplanes sp. NPDC048988]|uniref:hypothetical protein n=1 Tax=Actinoplanes sp. NPDC048988 TaxID=3363901 RepID=UPI00371AA08D
MAIPKPPDPANKRVTVPAARLIGARDGGLPARHTEVMTIKEDVPDGALRIEVFFNPPSGRFGLRIVDEGPRMLTAHEMQDVLAVALRNVTARRTIAEA